jgi:hypothetical protein
MGIGRKSRMSALHFEKISAYQAKAGENFYTIIQSGNEWELRINEVSFTGSLHAHPGKQLHKKRFQTKAECANAAKEYADNG